jgi:acetyl esterase
MVGVTAGAKGNLRAGGWEEEPVAAARPGVAGVGRLRRGAGSRYRAGRRRLLIRGGVVLAGAAGLALAGYAAVRCSPWPSTLLLRVPFEREARALARALRAHVPSDVVGYLDERYDQHGRRTRLDVFHPDGLRAGEALPTVVWAHGGAWLSGRKEFVADYLRILAGHGFTTVGVGYSIAPAGKYPLPVAQANAALAHLQRHAHRLHVDPDRLVLAGDSAGAQIMAQLANAVSDPAYAQALGVRPAIDRAQLRGTLLYCGAYDLDLVDMDGDWAWLLRTIMWAYTGTKRLAADPRLASASVAQHVTPAFPPAFVSAGNADPLFEQSRRFAAALADQHVPVDEVLFAGGTDQPPGHEFQFDLDAAAGQVALRRSVEFLRRVTV